MPRQRKDSSSSESDSEEKKSKTPMGMKKRYSKIREETLEERKGMKLIPKTKTVMSTEKLMTEHVKLIKVLKAELKDQSKELAGYKKKLKKDIKK
jgi:hypothetical protein